MEWPNEDSDNDTPPDNIHINSSFSPQDLSELGVAFLPNPRKNQVINSPQEIYSDYAQEMNSEYQRTKKPNYLKQDDLTYNMPDRSERHYEEDVFSAMSDEIILYILSFCGQSRLATVAQVNRRFRRLSYDKSLWQRIDVSKKVLKTGSTELILERGVKILRMTCATVLGPISHYSKKASPAQVEYLDLSEGNIQVEDLFRLSERLRFLIKLSLERCELNTSVLNELGKNRSLRTLNLAMCTGVTSEGLKAVVQHCQELESINLSWTGLDKNAVEHLVTFINPGLKEINISGHSLVFEDKHAIRLIKRCTGLIELDVSDCMNLSHAIVSVMSDTLYRLRTLSINRCRKISLTALKALSSLPNLQKINGHWLISNRTAACLSQQLPNIQLNADYFSTIARPCVGIRRTSIWKIRVRE